MANSCNLLHQKKGVGRGYLKNYSTKTYQMLFEIGKIILQKLTKCCLKLFYKNLPNVV